MKTKNRIISILLAIIMVLAIVPFSALTVFATEPEITEVSTFGELLNAVNSDKIYIKLTNNIKDIVPDDELPTKHRLVFDGGKEYVLDLNGYSLEVINHANEYYTSNFPMISVSGNSKLEIKDGSLGFDNWYAGNNRKARGVVHVEDTSTLVATHVNMQNWYAGNIVSATTEAKVTLDGGEYTVQNGFAIYLDRQASLTLDGDIYIHTVVGDSANTQYVDGYGALYSESTGELVIHNAFFKSGIQVNSSQIGAFSTATHELTINGKVMTEDIFVGTSTEAKNQNKEYFWYSYNQNALENVQNNSFVNTVKVISYDKKYPLEVMNGTATVNGAPVTEAGYGQTVTIVANTPEAGMEFVRWDTSGVNLASHYNATTTFTMPAAPVTLAAYYGKQSVSSVSATVGDMIPGQKAYDTEITLDGGVILGMVEWYEEDFKMDEDDIFKPGKTYRVDVLVYPPEDNKFADSVTAKVDGNDANVLSNTDAYVIFNYTFDTIPSVGFGVVYDNGSSQLGIGGKIVLDTALMSSQSASFKSALDAGKVTYQWYKNGEAIDGATESVYNLTAEDADGRFYVAVTADGKTNYGYIVNCSENLYQVYFNATEIIPGGKAPQLTSATPGIALDPESVFITEMKNGNPVTEAQILDKVVLTPGRSYRIVATIIENDVDVAYGANVHVNGNLMPNKVDGILRIYYDFDVPTADYDVYYKANGEIGIGVTLTVDIEKMCQESGTFKNAYEAANPTYQTVFYQWYKNGEAIKDATKASYTVKSTDKNSLINCVVTLVDGKCGVGEQFVISNVITVINVNMPRPKNGDNTIGGSAGISADGVTLGYVFWDYKGSTMQGSDTYVEGEEYLLTIQFNPKDGLKIDLQGDAAIAYIYGEKVICASSDLNGAAGYMMYVTAIHAHQYSDSVWDFEEDGHWHPCIVPGCPDPNEEWEGYMFHYGNEASCQTKGVCSVCGYEYYGEHDVAVPNYVYIDDMKCGSYCATEGCDHLSEWSYHTGGVSDCQHKSVCEICHHEYGEFAPCAGGTATCTEKAKCATCGNEYGELLPHNYNIENGYKGADGHANSCSCGAHEVPVAHTPDRAEATETDPIKCTVCDYIIEPVKGHVHSPKSEWKSDEDNHWRECTGCEGQQLEKAAHADTDNNGKCDTCEYQMSATHDNPNNTPDNPNNTPDDPKGDKDGLGAGAIVGIVISSVAVVGIGGFALFWFVIKKKSFADLIAVFKKK